MARRKDIVSIYNSFLSDESVEVQTEAKCIIGLLVYSYHPEGEVPPILLDCIIDLCPSLLGTVRHPVVVLERLAFYFPAIVLTFGGDNWSKLNVPFQRLSKLPNLEVTKPIAYGMHEIARIIPQDSCISDLYPVAMEMLKGPKEVKLGILSNLSPLLHSFPAEFLQQKFALIFEAVYCNSSSDWSVREVIARQLGKMARLISDEQQQKQIILQLLTYCNDHIGIIREVALDSLLNFFQSLDRADHLLPLVEELKKTKFKHHEESLEKLFQIQHK